MPQVEIPIQPVDDPILCSPYEEPKQHWLYDTHTGVPSKNPGRRPASYWYKSEPAGSAQRSLFAEEERDDLPLVNVLREDVRRWREAGWPNTSQTTKKLLRHWWRQDRARRLFFCQLEAVETVLYLREILAVGKTPRWKPSLGLDEFRMLEAGCESRAGRDPTSRERYGTCWSPMRIDLSECSDPPCCPRYQPDRRRRLTLADGLHPDTRSQSAPVVAPLRRTEAQQMMPLSV